jgi:hypothetical protein
MACCWQHRANHGHALRLAIACYQPQASKYGQLYIHFHFQTDASWNTKDWKACSPGREPNMSNVAVERSRFIIIDRLCRYAARNYGQRLLKIQFSYICMVQDASKSKGDIRRLLLCGM